MSKKQRTIEVPSKPQPYEPEFRNESQRIAYESSFKSDVVFILGQSGCGKTHAAALIAMAKVIAEPTTIYLVRAAVEATGETLGALPGSINEKMDAFTRPMRDELVKVCKKYRLSMPHMEVVPLGYMRGRNFENCIVWIDESQNLNRAQIKLALSRMCENSKYLISGDFSQTDIFDSFLEESVARLKHLRRVSVVAFKDHENARHPLVPHFNRLL